MPRGLGLGLSLRQGAAFELPTREASSRLSFVHRHPHPIPTEAEQVQHFAPEPRCVDRSHPGPGRRDNVRIIFFSICFAFSMSPHRQIDKNALCRCSGNQRLHFLGGVPAPDTLQDGHSGDSPLFLLLTLLLKLSGCFLLRQSVDLNSLRLAAISFSNRSLMYCTRVCLSSPPPWANALVHVAASVEAEFQFIGDHGIKTIFNALRMTPSARSRDSMWRE